MGNSSFHLEPPSFCGKFEISSRSVPAKKLKISKNSSPNLPKSRPGAPKIDSGAIQNLMELILNFYIDLGGAATVFFLRQNGQFHVLRTYRRAAGWL